MKYKVYIGLLVGMLLGIISCDSDDTEVWNPDFKMSMTKDVLVLLEGESEVLDLAFDPITAIGNVSWSMDDPKVATIDDKGKVVGVAAGMTKAKAICNMYEVTIPVYIKKQAIVDEIYFSEKTYFVTIGDEIEINLLTEPEKVDTKIRWEVGDESILSINDLGIAKGLKVGLTMLKAKIGDQEAFCNVYVKQLSTYYEEKYFFKDLCYLKLGASMDEMIAAEAAIGKRVAEIAPSSTELVFSRRKEDMPIKFVACSMYMGHVIGMQLESEEGNADASQAEFIRLMEGAGFNKIKETEDMEVFRNVVIYAHPDVENTWLICACVVTSLEPLVEKAIIMVQSPFED